MEDQGFLCYWLSNADQETVYSWLKENKPKKYSSILSADREDLSANREEVEKTLLKRDEPLVKLGLALFGSEPKTGLELYKNSDGIIRKAVLSGTTIRDSLLASCWINDPGILDELLSSKNEELLSALLSNQFIKDGFIVNLYKKKEPFHKLDEDFWLMLIGFTISNPRLSTPYDNKWMDGWDECSYGEVFTAGWKLFERVAVNKISARLLAYLGEKLVPDKPHDMKVKEVIKRWYVDTSDESVDYFMACRSALADLIKDFENDFKELKDSVDLALRQSYYRRFIASKKEEIRELFEKDKDKFLDEALNNKELYREENIRNELKQCCWDYKDPHHDILYPNIFNTRVDAFAKEHPEWFKDWDGDIPVNKIDDPLERANKHLEHIGKKIKIISEKLVESVDEDQQSLIEELRDNLNQVRTYLHQLSNNKVNLGWIWLIVGLLAGYFIAK